MPDVLDRMLEEIERRDKLASAVLLKTATGYREVPRSSIEEDWGGATEIERQKHTAADGTEHEVPVYEIKVTDADKKAQEDRSSKYSIGIKETTSVTMPKRWKDLDAKDDDFADPANYKFYIGDADHVRNALARWANDDIRGQYTADEQKIIKDRIDAAAKKFDIDVSDDSSKGAGGAVEKSSKITVEGLDFTREEVKDGLGRLTYRFTHGEPGSDVVPMGFVYQGTVASLVAPKDTQPEDMRTMIGLLSQHKSAKVQTKQGDFASALEDAMESLACNAISSAWYAFQSCVMNYWYGELEDLDDATYNSYVDQLGTALKALWAKYGNSADLMVQLAADHRLYKRVLAGKSIEKAGASISAANRSKLEDARGIINELLGVEKDDEVDKTANPDASTTAQKGLTDLAPWTLKQLRSELMSSVKEEMGTELGRVKAAQESAKRDNDDLRAKLAERDVLLEKYGKEPLPDPLANGAREKAAKSTGGTIYDMVQPSDY